MKCDVCGAEAKHYLACGLDVCQQCVANIVTIVVRDQIHYRLLLFEAAAMTYRMKQEERIDELGKFSFVSV